MAALLIILASISKQNKNKKTKKRAVASLSHIVGAAVSVHCEHQATARTRAYCVLRDLTYHSVVGGQWWQDRSPDLGCVQVPVVGGLQRCA